MINTKETTALINLYKEQKRMYTETEDLKWLVEATSTLNKFLKLVAGNNSEN